MINIITYPGNTEFLRPELYIGAFTIIHEVLTYPLQHIGTRCIAQLQNITFGNILNHRESLLIFTQLRQSGQLTVGLGSGLDMQFNKHVIRYFLFQYLFYRYAYREYVTPSYDPTQDEFTTYSPKNPEVFPLLKYIDFTDPRTLLVAAVANLAGVVVSQPISILSTMIQSEVQHNNNSYNERMKLIRKQHGGSNMVFLKPGFALRYSRNYICFVSEILAFQSLLRQDAYPFMNVYYNRTRALPSTSLFFPILYAGIVSALITTISHPLYIHEKRQVMAYIQKKNTSKIYQNEGLNGYIKGYVSSLIRNCSRNICIMAILWSTAENYNKYRFDHTGRFN